MKKDDLLIKPNYEAWNIEPLEATDFSKEDLYHNIVGWAILAANAHNVQPWKFILCPRESYIDVLVDEAGILSASDKVGRQAWISIGCGVSNLIIAANYYGLDAGLEFIHRGVRIRFDEQGSSMKRGIKKHKLLNAIKGRRVNRNDFHSEPGYGVPDIIVRNMRKIATEQSVGIEIITDAKKRADLSELQYEIERFAILDGDFRNELSDFILPNDTKEGRGMPGNTFGLNDTMSLHVHEEFAKLGVLDPSLAVGIASTNRDLIRNSPLTCILLDDDDRPEGWLRAGRVLQEILLLAEMNDLGVSIHAGLVELFDESIFHRKYYAEEFYRILSLSSGRPLVLFRMGYAQNHMPHSPRVSSKEVAEFAD